MDKAGTRNGVSFKGANQNTPKRNPAMDSLVEMFCDVDDFCQEFQPQWEQKQLTTGIKQRRRRRQLCQSEIMTIIIHFHQSNYRAFKPYYQEHVMKHLRREFPNLVSYPRFVTLMKEAILPLSGYLYSLFGTCSGVSFVDATSLEIGRAHV